VAEVLIVRHAEPELRGVFLGSLDPGLSLVGVDQARGLCVDSGLPVYVSPKRRARETAEAAGLEYQILEGLREIDYGPWEGMTWQDIEARFPEEAALKMADWLGYTAPGAEPWHKFQARVEEALAQCERPCVIVAHLAVNSVLRELITGEAAIGFRQAYCEIVRL
jgi:broad specificity phosphatase PhoE